MASRFEVHRLHGLLNAQDINASYASAKQLTFENFGLRRKIFNPIYLSNICLADCEYCGFRVSNKSVERRTLNPAQTIDEADFLNERGVRNFLILAGDYRHDRYVEMLRINILELKNSGKSDWIGIEVATLEAHEYEILKAAGADAVFTYQETYDRTRYDELHHRQFYKGSYDERINAQERAVNAGFKEVGFGVLYGIHDWEKDTIMMSEHIENFQAKYPHVKINISFPRLQDSEGQSKYSRKEHVSPEQLLRCIVGMRLLFPNANLILTGRESVEYLTTHASIATILGYKGSTIVGGYRTYPQSEAPQYIMPDAFEFEFFKRQLEEKYLLY
jgi:2-iminoacetate synthase